MIAFTTARLRVASQLVLTPARSYTAMLRGWLSAAGGSASVASVSARRCDQWPLVGIYRAPDGASAGRRVARKGERTDALRERVERQEERWRVARRLHAVQERDAERRRVRHAVAVPPARAHAAEPLLLRVGDAQDVAVRRNRVLEPRRQREDRPEARCSSQMLLRQ